MNFVLQGMGDFLNEMVTMMSQTKSNVSPIWFFFLQYINFCLLAISGKLGDYKAKHNEQCCFIIFCLVDKGRQK
jgi:hypothetical protein